MTHEKDEGLNKNKTCRVSGKEDHSKKGADKPGHFRNLRVQGEKTIIKRLTKQTEKQTKGR